MSAPISLVLAVADNGVIGDRGRIPWRIPEDMRRFKALTLGKPVIMGRKTWESLPKKPLVDRTNIVVTRDKTFWAEGALVVNSLDEAIARAQEEKPGEIAVIGGAEIYSAVLPRTSIVHLTEVHAKPEGDASMAPFDKSIWKETAREDRRTPDGLGYSYVTLERR
ncbi:MAG: dihydrofolate reductase [Proteobacteria bacterium]|nr:dihydrofolate reductase [Pseudomonadota bacterium]